MIAWTAQGAPHAARWRSESGQSAPGRVVLADDRMDADTAYRLACEGTGLLWCGDFQNGRQLLQALTRRADRSREKSRAPPARAGRRQALGGAALAAAEPGSASPRPAAAGSPADAAQAFHLHRQAQAQRARTLGMLLLRLEADHSLALRRAPDLRQACTEAYGPGQDDDRPYVASMRELLGLVSAHEWRSTGVPVAALDARIHPHYGVFAPVRSEYLALVQQAPLPQASRDVSLAWDIGTGTGVLAALLARRGLRRVLATDCEPRALACAADNLQRLGLAQGVELQQRDLFPPGRAPLIVCNPPWLPARPTAPIEAAVYDPDSRMLRGFLAGLASHLAPGGEGWLVLSDLAEHLGLRTRAELLGWIDAAGLRLIKRTEVRPVHARAQDPDDPLHRARAAERTSLWRLAALPGLAPHAATHRAAPT